MPGGWVYLVANRYRGTIYTGVTADLARRAWQLDSGDTVPPDSGDTPIPGTQYLPDSGDTVPNSLVTYAASTTGGPGDTGGVPGTQYLQGGSGDTTGGSGDTVPNSLLTYAASTTISSSRARASASA